MLRIDAFRNPGWMANAGKIGLRIFLSIGLLASGFGGRAIQAEDKVAPSPLPRPMPVGKPVPMAAGTATLISVETLPWVTNEYSARFRYDSADNPKLAELRKRHSLDAVVAPGKDEFQKQLLLMDWTHRQFRKFGKPTSDARGAAEILAGIEAGHTYFCAQYAQVLVSASASLGWVNRPLALRRHQGVAKVGGSTEHSVTEIWSNQHRKWVMLDPTSNLHVERDGLPLNAVEIRQEWFYRGGTNLVFVAGSERKRYRKADLPIFVARMEGFGELTFEPDEPDKYGFTAFIPNTDLMDSGYEYGKMFIVKDGVCDGTQWHERKVPAQPLVEPYFPIGQAALRILEESGQVVVQIDTLTPNLARFEVRMDGGDWVERPVRWVWDLRPGRNRMEARTVNRFGVTGPESGAVVEFAR